MNRGIQSLIKFRSHYATENSYICTNVGQPLGNTIIQSLLHFERQPSQLKTGPKNRNVGWADQDECQDTVGDSDLFSHRFVGLNPPEKIKQSEDSKTKVNRGEGRKYNQSKQESENGNGFSNFYNISSPQMRVHRSNI